MIHQCLCKAAVFALDSSALSLQKYVRHSVHGSFDWQLFEWSGHHFHNLPMPHTYGCPAS